MSVCGGQAEFFTVINTRGILLPITTTAGGSLSTAQLTTEK